MWRDDYYDDDGNHGWCDWYDKCFEWYESYQNRKAQEASIKEEPLCQKMKKESQKNYGHKHGLFCV